MKSLDWSDLHITAEEYFEILREAWEKSEFFDNWDRKWHPEDLHANLEVVFDGVGCGLISYTHLVGKNVRKNQYNSNKKTVDDMNQQPVYTGNEPTQVFGGTLPRGQWDEYFKLSPSGPRGGRDDTFGDNA